MIDVVRSSEELAKSRRVFYTSRKLALLILAIGRAR